MADGPKAVDQLCVEHGLDARQLAEKCGLDEGRVLAIVLGRWTPSPQERDAIARVFGRTAGRLPNIARIFDQGAVMHLATLRPTQPETVWSAKARPAVGAAGASAVDYILSGMLAGKKVT